MSSESEHLPEVHPPYLPRKEILDSPYTLVLDLDETLIHFVSVKEQISGEQGNVPLEEGEDDFFYNIRPYCNRFLAELSNHFELVVYTAAV